MYRIGAIAFAGVLLVVASGSAQRTWLPGDNRPSMGVDINAGLFATGNDIGAQVPTSLITLFGRFSAWDGFRLTSEIPLSYVSEAFADSFVAGRVSGVRLGNPWFGVATVPRQGVAFEVGIRPNLVGLADETDFAAVTFGALADFDHSEAWSTHVTTIRGLARIGSVPAYGSFVTGTLGAKYGFGTGGSGNPFVVTYGLRAGFQANKLLWSAAWTGAYTLDDISPGATFDDRMINQVAVAVERTKGTIRPQFGLRTYLDPSIRDEVKAVITLGATYYYY